MEFLLDVRAHFVLAKLLCFVIFAIYYLLWCLQVFYGKLQWEGAICTQGEWKIYLQKHRQIYLQKQRLKQTQGAFPNKGKQKYSKFHLIDV